MIVETMALYEGVVGVGVVVGILFLLYSGDFVVIHRRFLGIIALGSGITAISQVVFLVYWPTGIQFAHLLFILIVTIGLYSFITGYSTHDDGPFRPQFAK